MSTQPATRFIGLDVHKHYLVAVGFTGSAGIPAALPVHRYDALSHPRKPGPVAQRR